METTKRFSEVRVLRVLVLVLAGALVVLFAFGSMDKRPASSAALLSEAPRITPAQAEEAALAYVQRSTVRKLRLDELDGRPVYSVALDAQGKDVEVMVDANSGDIARAEYHLLMYAPRPSLTEQTP